MLVRQSAPIFQIFYAFILIHRTNHRYSCRN